MFGRSFSVHWVKSALGVNDSAKRGTNLPVGSSQRISVS